MDLLYPIFYARLGLLFLNVETEYTLSGHTGSALVWHSEGRTIEALSVQ